MRGLTVGAALVFLAISSWGQQFEVVSVKPNKSGSGNSSTNSDQGRLTATNLSLRSLIVMAYGVKDYQVEAPDWMREERFDIAAKFPEGLPAEGEEYNQALHAMMRQMLTERFKLETHRDTKTLPVYGLVAAKGGVKFKEVPDSGHHNQNNNNNHYTATSVSMSAFAEFLARREEIPVLDMTERKGVYDLTLDWAPEVRRQTDKPEAVAEASEKPPLEVAITEQLGLKLEARKAPIEILIVDHAERVPTEN
jgi:uncharacterized protein (TIGR03435 family)